MEETRSQDDEQAPGRQPVTDGARPRRADGLELLGRYEGSGFKDPPYLVRRADGQVVQLPHALYAVVDAADGTADARTIADRVTQTIERRVEPDDIALLIDKKLRPLGLMGDGADATGTRPAKADPVLALTFKKGVVPAGVVRAITAALRPTFSPAVVVVALAALAAFDVWLFGVHGIAQGIRALLYQPLLLLVVFALVVLAAALHECGHATACAYGGGMPGEMGVGLYVVWPVFYTDVTDAYRLGRAGRLRTDLGGVYYHALFILLLAGAYALTGSEIVLLVAFVLHLAILQQFMPFLRLDGYYVIADLTGVPDMFTRIRPILASLLPWRETDRRVRDLKPWARAVVTLWVLTIVPVMLVVIVWIVARMPRIIATAWDSMRRFLGQASDALSRGDVLEAAAGGVQALALLLPAAAAAVTIVRVGRRVVGAGWRATHGRPGARLMFAGACLVAVAGVAAAWAPGDEYRPIEADDRWTVREAADPIVRRVFRTSETGTNVDPGAGEPADDGSAPTDPDGATTDDAPDVTSSTAPDSAPDSDASSSPATSPEPEATSSPSPTGSVASSPPTSSSASPSPS